MGFFRPLAEEDTAQRRTVTDRPNRPSNIGGSDRPGFEGQILPLRHVRATERRECVVEVPEFGRTSGR